MNKFLGIGVLTRDGILKGKDKNVLRFTLATPLGKNRKTKKERFAFVPCVIFRPASETKRLLCENAKGIQIGLQGRVNTSKYETKDGQTKYATDVIVDENTIKVVEDIAIFGKADEGAKVA